MSARLNFLTGSKSGHQIPLDSERVTIGREADQDIRFVSGEVLVSGRHAVIERRGDSYFIRDVGSRNGTFINKRRVDEHLLQSGDLIEFGPNGPSAEFASDQAAELLPTLDGTRPTMGASGIYHLARTRADELKSSGVQRPFSTTREFMALAYRRSDRRLKWAVAGLAVALVAAVAVLTTVNLRTRAAFEANLAELQNFQTELSALSAALEEERASNTFLADDLARIQTRYDSLRSEFTTRRRETTATVPFGQQITESYSDGVALIVYTYSFVNRQSGDLLRFRVDSRGRVLTGRAPSGEELPLITFGGRGPPVERFGSATGFLIDSAGWLVTNRHVAEPWVDDAELESLRERGLPIDPQFTVLRAYFPPGDRTYPLVVEHTGATQDVAVLRSLVGGVEASRLPLSLQAGNASVGQDVIFLGYPTGVHNLMFRVSREVRAEIIEEVGEDADPLRLVEELSRRRLIQPLVVSGTISDVTPTEIIHTADVTGGASGGPIFGVDRRVIAVHYAYVQSPIEGDPFRTQRGVRASFAWELLPEAVRSRIGQ